MTSTIESQLREELTHYCRVAYQRQLVSGTGGNLSARVPGTDRVLITPSAVSLRECTPVMEYQFLLAGATGIFWKTCR